MQRGDVSCGCSIGRPGRRAATYNGQGPLSSHSNCGPVNGVKGPCFSRFYYCGLPGIVPLGDSDRSDDRQRSATSRDRMGATIKAFVACLETSTTWGLGHLDVG